MLKQPGVEDLTAKQRIYCIEGFHGWDGVEWTVEPMLELLQRLGAWDYLYRTCSTKDELRFRLEDEWNKSCTNGSVLYFFTHGDHDQVCLRNDDKSVGLLTLKEWPDCEGCHVHFAGVISQSTHPSVSLHRTNPCSSRARSKNLSSSPLCA